jgi:hypothetical protein
LTWFGGPTERVLMGFFDANDALIARARGDGKPFVLVVDTAFAKAPSPRLRKVIAKLTNAQPIDGPAQTRSIIVIENAIIRGVVTALRWIIPRMKDSRIVGSVGQAIDLALRILDEDGTARPSALSATEYRRPTA